METYQQIVDKLELEPIDQEGGWFRRVHTGEPDATGRALSTTIYALFTQDQFSALHRLDAVEQFFFLDGDPFEVFRIDGPGQGCSQRLDRKSPHLVFEPGCWFGGTPVADGSHGWTLMSCVVTPGFDWKGFAIGKQSELLAEYPEFEEPIRRLTRG